MRLFAIRHALRLPVAGCFVLAQILFAHAPVTLQADGPGNTYELINSKLGGTAEEVPDCAHPESGRHITEDWDDILGKNVFILHIHVTPDNDRCSAFDRQRNEIKTYGDVCSYRWKFKLDAAFQPSPNFCHIHQIKAGDGSDSGSPLMTIAPHYASSERLEIAYTAPTGLSGSARRPRQPVRFQGSVGRGVRSGAVCDERCLSIHAATGKRRRGAAFLHEQQSQFVARRRNLQPAQVGNLSQLEQHELSA